MRNDDDDQRSGGGDWFDAQGPAPAAPVAAEPPPLDPTATAVVPSPQAATGGGRTDRAAIAAKVAQWAAMPDSDPSLGNDPDYWINRIIELGGLGSDNEKYWQDASVGPTAFFRNPGREGNQYGALNAGFGAPPAPYQSNPNAPVYQAPEVPAHLATPYAAPAWQGGDFKTPDKPVALQTPFAAPTKAELEASPGYGARMDAGFLALNRSAAAKGSVLSGGTQKVLNRYGQDYASNEYSNLFGQKVTERGIADQEYGADVGNAANQFGTNFSVFQTGANNAMAARQQNEGEYQANVVGPTQTAFANRYSSYLSDNARTLNDYLTNYGIQHTAEGDYWNRLKDVSGAGLDAAKNSRAA